MTAIRRSAISERSSSVKASGALAIFGVVVGRPMRLHHAGRGMVVGDGEDVADLVGEDMGEEFGLEGGLSLSDEADPVVERPG